MVILPTTILVVYFSILIRATFIDFILLRKSRKLFDEYCGLISLVTDSFSDINDHKVIIAVSAISTRMGKINKLNKESLVAMRELITELEILLAPFDSDLAIKIRQRNIKNIIN